MANVFSKTPNADGIYTYIRSANTPDYTPTDWLHNPDVSALESGSPVVPEIYWKAAGSPLAVVEMTQEEKDAVSPSLIRGEHETVTFEGQTVMSSSYHRVAAFLCDGSGHHGVPHKIEVLGHVDSGVTGDVRVYDKTNGVVLASKTFTNTEEDKIELTLVDPSPWPSDEAIVEIHAKRTVGTEKEKVYLNSMVIGY